MIINDFFTHFLEELKGNKNLWKYYKFLSDSKNFYFRKAYFCQRLKFIENQIQNPGSVIWDCGCGYGTTALFLAMNGFSVFGSTLEFYFEEIENRRKYWNQFGNANLFSCNYENVFDSAPSNQSDYIIVQDTLHHMEPIDKAIQILSGCLKPKGVIIAIEENGNNIIQNLKLFKQRGFKKKIKYFDKSLNKTILIGNENIRGLNDWTKLFQEQNFEIENDKTEYIRFYPPFMFKEESYEDVISKEKSKWKNSPFLREYFFFGLNFTAKKKNP